MLKSSFMFSEALEDVSKSTFSGNPDASYPKLEFSTSITRSIPFKIRHQVPTRPSSKPQKFHESTGSGKKFRYSRKLERDIDPEVIRLLEVAPGDAKSSIRCNLIYACLRDDLEYDALSYCWGDEVASLEIECNQQSLYITKNLASALRAFQKPDVPLLIWVDAICIDQSSQDEKNCQIPLMRRIYEKASAVRVWLGTDSERRGEKAFRAITSLRNACMKLGWETNMLNMIRTKRLEQYGVPDVVDPIWLNVGDLIQRPWFGRAWIIQELLVAKSAILYLDSSSISWNDFYVGTMFGFKSGMMLAFSQALSIDLVLGLTRLSQLLTSYSLFVKSKLTNTSGLDLMELLINHRPAQATDPRDKVYALLGLSDLIDNQEHGINPDYERSPSDVFIKVAERALEVSNTLDILSISRIRGESTVGKLPSWVPEWTISDLSSPLCFKKHNGDYALDFDASKTKEIAKHAIIHGRVLELSGFIFDRICRLGRTLDLYPAFGSSDAQMNNFGLITTLIGAVSVQGNWKKIAQCNGKRIYPTGEDRFDAYLRTLHMDDFGSSTLAKVRNTHRVFSTRAYHRIYGKLDSELFQRIVFFLERSMPLIGLVRLKKNQKLDDTAGLDMIAYSKIIHRRLFRTDQGYLGLAPQMAQENDSIVLVKGGRIPLLLRPVRSNEWQLIGDCYVQGIMHGEAFNEDKCKEMNIV